MLYCSTVFFVIALVAALFGFVLAANASFALFAKIVCAAFLALTALTFVIDRAVGFFELRRAYRAASPRSRRDARGASTDALGRPRVSPQTH
jgi:uncharacterized membrane protein YtjA (UPF0391 family)